MPNSALSRAATSEWCTPSTVKVATGNLDCSGAGPSTRTPGIAVEPGPKPACQLAVVTLDLRPPDDVELVDRGVQSDGAEHVGGAGLLPLGRIRPDHFVEVDEIDGTTAGQERVTVGERRSRANECAGAERRVHLVAAPGDEVDARRQPAMRCELGCVEEHGYVALVRGVGDRIDRRHPSGDVRRARDGQELGPRCRVERGDDVVEPERAVASALHEPAPARTRPRQQVGVMLDDGRDDDVVTRELQAVRELVDRLGRVPADDRDVGAVGRSLRESRASRPGPVRRPLS